MNSSKKSEHVLDTMHQNWFCPWGPFCCKVLSFLPSYKIYERVWAWPKCIKSKKQHHFEKATHWDLKLWFVHFSFHVKRFRQVVKKMVATYACHHNSTIRTHFSIDLNFKMMHCMSFYHSWHRKCEWIKLKLPNLLTVLCISLFTHKVTY